MNHRKALCFAILFFCNFTQQDGFFGFVVWNVGQGQMVSNVQPSQCLHFDSGGEFLSIPRLLEFCQNRRNIFYVSHDDWDHIGLIKKLSLVLPHSCLHPLSSIGQKRVALLKWIPLCRTYNPFVVRLIPEKPYKSKNDNSHIFIFKKFLFTGDISKIREGQLIKRTANSFRPRYLMVPHHGSKTSNSDIFLEKLKPSQLALISARKKAYGHPHPLILQRLKLKNISALPTETWGNIFLHQ